MRKFIVSDLHGNGEVYDSIMAYLENIALLDEVHLYINGDLIDRGFDSLRMILDAKERIEGKGFIHIHYLAGNHELMMYDALRKRKPGKNVPFWNDWIQNGGWVIEGETECMDDGEEVLDSLRDFAGELKIYHLFSETILNNPIVLVHAQPPKTILKECPLRIKDDDFSVFSSVWKRENSSSEWGLLGRLMGNPHLGKEGYFTIIGHTPVNNSKGFLYNSKENYLNIDGGCSAYATGFFQYDHVPLVEIEDGLLTILVFNHNNEIINGFSFDGGLHRLEEDTLNKKRVFLDPNLNGNGEENKNKILEFLK